MNVIARTGKGVLIEATDNEVNQILNAVLGSDKDRKIDIGTKIPAVDYSATITKLKGLRDSYDIKRAIENTGHILDDLEKLRNQLELKED